GPSALGSLARRAFEDEREEVFEELVVGQGFFPAVGGEDGGVEAAVGEVEPSGTLIVEICERPLRQVLSRFRVLGYQSWITDGADAAGVGIVNISPPGTVGRAGEFQ